MAVEVEPCFPAGSMKVEEFVDEVPHLVMAAGYGRHLGGASELGSELSQLEFGVTTPVSSIYMLIDDASYNPRRGQGNSEPSKKMQKDNFFTFTFFSQPRFQLRVGEDQVYSRSCRPRT